MEMILLFEILVAGGHAEETIDYLESVKKLKRWIEETRHTADLLPTFCMAMYRSEARLRSPSSASIFCRLPVRFPLALARLDCVE